MHLADRIFSVVTNPENVRGEVREGLPELGREDDLRYWREGVSGCGLVPRPRTLAIFSCR